MKCRVFLFYIALLSCAARAQTLPFGNPSNAAADLANPNNYLVVHNDFTLSYNRERSAANRVAWTLNKSNTGSAERTDALLPIRLCREKGGSNRLIIPAQDMTEDIFARRKTEAIRMKIISNVPDVEYAAAGAETQPEEV